MLPMHNTTGTGDCCVVTGMLVEGTTVVSGIVVVVVVALVTVGAVVATVDASAGTLQVSPVPLHTTLNVVDVVTSCRTPETFTMYPSGVKLEVSTLKDHVFMPLLPATTLTVPLVPEKPDGCVFEVGV